MSMIGNYLPVSEEELNSLKENPKSLSEFIYETKEDDIIDIDKAWHAIHFTLNGSEWEGSEPYFKVVLGGTPISDEDVGYGPARSLSPSEVKGVALALEEIDEKSFRSKFDPKELKKNDIYPQIWDEGEELLDYIADNYNEVRETFKDASINNQAMILFLC